MTDIFKVEKCGDKFTVSSKKSDSGELTKRNLVFRKLGGDFADRFSVSALGEQAELSFKEGELIFAKLRFQVHTHDGQVYQDITASEIVKFETEVF